MPRIKYTDEDIIKYAQEVTSMAQLLSKLGLKQAGGNFDNMKRKLQKLNILTPHWRGKAWNKEQQLKDWSQYTRGMNLKPHLIKDRGHHCEGCGLDEWCKRLITLEVHHIDGNKCNNEYTNLKLLCPNCHSQTKNWKNKTAL